MVKDRCLHCPFYNPDSEEKIPCKILDKERQPTKEEIESGVCPGLSDEEE